MARYTSTAPAEDRRELVVDEVRASDGVARTSAARLAALVAGAVPAIIGGIALARIDWSPGGLDAPPVDVAGMTFRPWIAIATLALGVIALLTAATYGGEGRLAVGAVLACGGIVIVLANPTVQDVRLDDRFGWMWVVVGAVLCVAGLVGGTGWSSRRAVRTHHDRVA